jgi:Arc/MetJ-type ribon-helix-helix transcriptional regulator
MKTITVRLSEPLAADIEAESRLRKVSRSDVIRDRLEAAGRRARLRSLTLEAIADLIGSVEGLPSDLSSRRKAYLKETRYGQKRTR